MANQQEVEREVKERPILMTTESVRAILDGRKTMTRRTQGLDKINGSPDEWVQPWQLSCAPDLWTWRSTKTGNVITLKCPYGQVGDRLWVRETFCKSEHIVGRVLYRAEGVVIAPSWKWKPSIFMPRWASRITLEITGVRVERLQEITEEDAIAEGCYSDAVIVDTPIGKDYTGLYARDRFLMEVWDPLNAKRGYGWDTNPWVWVISFKVAK